MLKEALSYLRENLGVAKEYEIDGAARDSRYFDREVYPCPLPDVPRPEPLMLSTLSGLVGYVEADIDKIDMGSHLIHVGADRVEVLGPLSHPHRRREVLARASYTNETAEVIGRPMPIDRIFPLLQEHFERNNDLDLLLSILSEIDVIDAEKRTRSGIGYEVKVNRSVGGPGWQKINDPFVLRPYRSFPEAGEQTASRFILDIDARRTGDQSEVTVVLREIGDRSWVPAAAEAVGKKIEDALNLLDVDTVPRVIW